MLIGNSKTLPGGTRVRVRLARLWDLPAIEALCARAGVDADPDRLAALLRADPRTRDALCATTWIGGREAVVGFATARRGANAPDLAVADDACAPGVGALLAAALGERGPRFLALHALS